MTGKAGEGYGSKKEEDNSKRPDSEGRKVER